MHVVRVQPADQNSANGALMGNTLLFDLIDAAGAGAVSRIDPEWPFVGMKRHQRGQEDRHSQFLVVVADSPARVAPHQLIVHQVVIPA